jgi:hypothetical protein
MESGKSGGGGKGPGKKRAANDNRSPEGLDVEGDDGVPERLDAVVLSIARLIGRRMAREDYEKPLRAANDDAPPATPGGVGPGAEDEG